MVLCQYVCLEVTIILEGHYPSVGSFINKYKQWQNNLRACESLLEVAQEEENVGLTESGHKKMLSSWKK